MSTETTVAEVIKEMDAAARANLEPSDLWRYESQRDMLLADGTSPVDLDMILRGFIWDWSEEGEADDDE